MNQSLDPANSLYSGGLEGTGRAYVSLHDAILDPSNGWKHAAHLARFIVRIANEQDFILSHDNPVKYVKDQAYLVLMECDGGLDHNLTFLQISYLYLNCFWWGIWIS